MEHLHRHRNQIYFALVELNTRANKAQPQTKTETKKKAHEMQTARSKYITDDVEHFWSRVPTSAVIYIELVVRYFFSSLTSIVAIWCQIKREEYSIRIKCRNACMDYRKFEKIVLAGKSALLLHTAREFLSRILNQPEPTLYLCGSDCLSCCKEGCSRYAYLNLLSSFLSLYKIVAGVLTLIKRSHVLFLRKIVQGCFVAKDFFRF